MVKNNQWIDLNVRGIKVLTPNPSSNSSVRYYVRDGMQELFNDLLDMREGQQYFNIDFFGPPGTGKSSLCWAVAEHLGSEEGGGKDVIWAERRSRGVGWMICQFKDSNLYQFPKVPETLEDILKMKEFKDSNVLIMDTPISISNSEDRKQGAAGYAWTGDTHVHNSRIGQRRVIHVSSLGASTRKQTERCMIIMQERVMRPWTRQDFINALQDPDLKKEVCNTLDIPADEASNQTAEDLVDRKFYYSGINARWFFNFTILEIQAECEDIIKKNLSE